MSTDDDSTPPQESENRKPKKTPPPRKPWAGVEDVTALAALEQHLCRCEARTTLFGGNDEKVLRYDHIGMAGRMVDVAYDFLKKLLDDFPTKSQLADHILKPTVQLNVLTKFLKGEPPAGTDWFKHARTILKYLILGDAPEAEGDRVQIYARIEEYFFRHAKDKEASPFFRQARRRHGSPCSRKETASEISWHRRQAALSGKPAELIFVSGGAPFFPEGVAGDVANAVSKAITHHVDVTFVHYPRMSGADDVNTNLREFFRDHPKAKVRKFSELDLSRNQDHLSQDTRWWSFCSEVVQYLCLSATDENGDVQHTLYLVRQPHDEDLIPYALRATQAEVDAFLEWWRQLKPLCSPNPLAEAEGREPPAALTDQSGPVPDGPEEKKRRGRKKAR